MMTKHADPIDQLDALLEESTVVPGNDPVPARGTMTSPALPILVAITEDAQREGVLAVAAALSEQRGGMPTLMHTLEISPATMPDAMVGYGALVVELRDAPMRAWTEERLRADLQLSASPAATWPLRVELGSAAGCIVEHARRSDARLIVLGMHRHTRLGRALGNDTLRAVVAQNAAPVLAVRPELRGLPKRVAVAMDFSSASRRAAHLARRIMDEHGTLYLVNVSPATLDDVEERTEGARLIHARGIKAAFAELVAELDVPRGMTVATVACRGNPVQEIVDFAAGANVELVAVGRQRHTLAERLRHGSVTSALIADGRWSLLVTPQGSTESL